MSCYLCSARPPEWPRRALGDLRAGHTVLPALLTEKGQVTCMCNDDINWLRYLTQNLTFHRGVLDEKEHIVLREDPGTHPNSLTQPTEIKNMIYFA